METLRYELRISADDYLAARRLSLRPRRGMRWTLVVLGVPALLVLGVDFVLGAGRGQARPFLPALLGAGVFLLAWYYVLLPRHIRRFYREANDPSAPPLAGELSDTGLTVTSGGMAGALPWADVARWKHNDQMILLFNVDDEFTMIPLRGFATGHEREAALELLERHLGPPVA